MMQALAYVYHVQGKQEPAIALYMEVIIASPENTDARYNLGLVLWSMSRHQAAAEQFRQILERAPDDDQTLYNLGKLLLEAEQYGEAVEVLGQYLELQPADAEAYLLLAHGFRLQERFDRALDAYDQALTHQERNAEAWFYSSLIFLTEVEDPNRGLTALTQALDYGFNDQEALNALLGAENLLERDRVEELLSRILEE
jgi:tetratricopeptide (TPR) repeat protein